MFCAVLQASSTFLRISDILTNCGGLKNHFCDLLAAVRSVGEDRVISVRDPHGGDARQQKTTRDVRLFDQSSDCLVSFALNKLGLGLPSLLSLNLDFNLIVTF